MKNFGNEAKDLHFVLLYGSQLGQAKSIAEGFETVAGEEHNLKTKAFALNDVPDITDLVKIDRPIVIVTSTTGDGDPPENADKFWRKVRRKTLDKKTLLLVRYTILGLGDTNYNNFCNCGKTIHQRFQDLGATLFHPPGWADDGTGLELVVEDWTQNLWPALKKAIGIHALASDTPKILPLSSESSESTTKGEKEMNGTAKTSPPDAGGEAKALSLPLLPSKALIFEYEEAEKVIEYDPMAPQAPYPLIDGSPVEAVISSAKILTKSGALKTTLQVTLQVPQGFEFQPGDAVGIVCSNPSGEVERIFRQLDVLDQADKPLTIKLNSEVAKGKIPPHVPHNSTLRNIFTYICDIRTPPKKALLRYLGESCSEESEKVELLTFSSKQGSAEFTEKILNPGVSLLDLLLKYSSCKPSPQVLVEHLPRLQPRAYSICSSPLDSSSQFDVAFNIIEIPQEEPRQYARRGLCTGALYELCKEKFKDNFEDVNAIVDVEEVVKSDMSLHSNKIVVYRRKNQNFRLPQDISKPIIMVGPGTGVAPFIGFIRHRQLLLKDNPSQELGKSLVYFGCRHKEKDFLYEDELNTFVSQGALTKLNVSFSRDENQEGIKYVQDRMLLHKEELVAILLEDEGYLYVCGDAKNMAKNVREAVVKSIQVTKGLDEKDALAAVTNLVISKRYLQDIWG